MTADFFSDINQPSRPGADGAREAEFTFPLPYDPAEEDQREGRLVMDLMARSVDPYPDTERGILVEDEVPQNVLLSTLDEVLAWARKSSMWPAMFGLACCAIEMITAGTSRFDISRFGMEIFRPSPRQADLMIVAGWVTWKMAPVLRRVYDQMAEPKWVVAMGVSAMSGGPFVETYSVVPGVNLIVPVDVYIPGCPPRPEALFAGLIRLQERVQKEQRR